MSDFSPVVPWVFLALGVGIAIRFGQKTKQSFGCAGSAAIAVCLGLVLTFLNVFALGACVEIAKLCVHHGDTGLSYVFHSLFAIPVFWALLVVSV
jgi:hypothetical protein